MYKEEDTPKRVFRTPVAGKHHKNTILAVRKKRDC
jgi:hypothetical protein